MIRGTTPTFHLIIDEHDLTGAKVFVTIEGNKNDVKLNWVTGDEGYELVSASEESSEIAITLSQEQSLLLPTGKAEVQVRWIFPDGSAKATEPATIEVGKVLFDQEIKYEDGE